MEHRPCTRHDLSLVFRNMSDRNREEMQAAEFSPGEAMLMFREAMKRGEAKTLIHRGEVVALLAWARDTYDDGHEYLGTSFVGTEAFFQPRVPSVLFGARFLRKLQREAGNIMIVSQCYANHPMVRRWYEAMGYQQFHEDEASKSFVLQVRA